ILSSHILAEISAVCQHIMIISRGNLVANDTLENLEAIANKSNKLRLTVRGEIATVLEKLRSIEGVLSAEGEEKDGVSTVRLELEKEGDHRDAIFFAMGESKTPILSMDYEETTLEDIFLAMTDDNVYPDEDGNLPSIEEILSRRGRSVDGDEIEETDENTPLSEEEAYRRSYCKIHIDFDGGRPLFSTDREEDNE
ncbi:MAG: hypothetical protein II297_01115, partial [Clostridia bacterium]|nr:hypothetical protein [Clostridia bacterium]